MTISLPGFSYTLADPNGVGGFGLKPNLFKIRMTPLVGCAPTDT